MYYTCTLIKMKIIKKVLAGAFIFSVLTRVDAQCLTDQKADEFMHDHPETISKKTVTEKEIQEYSKTRGASARRAKYIVPVVFHVIHLGGEENITKAQIDDQMRVINEDFQRQNKDSGNLRNYFKSRAANLDIEFRLAKIDPNGNCTDGVNRIYSNLTVNAGEAVKNLNGAQWDYRKYLNIYVVQSIESGGAQGIILGYARFPWATNSGTDGILIRADRVGTIGTAVASGAGRTLTHEIGHWLGLMHPFQGGCSNSQSRTDNVEDTPPVASSFTNANCPANGNSCSNDNPNELDLWENYMDYSRGSCQNMFTKGQKTRTDFFLVSTSYTRRLNVSQSNLVATGVLTSDEKPVASFSSDRRVVCAGEPVKFYDGSCKGMVDSRQWNFVGADISSTNVAQPVVVYNQPGLYKVSLEVTNSNGSTSSSVDDYIEVRPSLGEVSGVIREDFQKPINQLGEFFPVDLGSGTFEIFSQTGHRSSQCLIANINSSVSTGTKYILESKGLDVRHLRNLPKYLTFMTAYAQVPAGTSQEELRVYVSTDCGAQWSQVYYRPSTSLGWNTSPSNNFVPSSDDQWRRQFVNLGQVLSGNDSNFRIRIEITADIGNPVYLDNINISQFISSTPKVEGEASVDVYPNPASDKVFLSAPGKVSSIRVSNAVGKIVCNKAITGQSEGLNNYPLDVSHLKNGVYIVQFVSDNNTLPKK